MSHIFTCLKTKILTLDPLPFPLNSIKKNLGRISKYLKKVEIVVYATHLFQMFSFSFSKYCENLKLFNFLNIKLQKQLQNVILDKCSIKWDIPDSCGKGGTTTTGNVARELLYNPKNRFDRLGLSEKIRQKRLDKKI